MPESTTPDLVELVRRYIKAVDGGDLDASMSFFAPDAVFESVGMGASFEGVSAIRGVLEDMLHAYEEFEATTLEVLDIGNGVVFGVACLSGRLRGSTGWVKTTFPGVSVWVDGLVIRLTTFPSYGIDEARWPDPLSSVRRL